MFFNFFKRIKNKYRKFSIKRMTRKFGYTATVQMFANFVCDKFSPKTVICNKEMTQFLREEADAASQGNEYAQNFARKLFSDPSEYMGAMGEEAKYPIDQPGGPQEVMLKITQLLMADGDTDFMVKFRCSVAERVALMQKVLAICIKHDSLSRKSTSGSSPGASAVDQLIDQRYPTFRSEMQAGGRVTEYLMENYPEVYVFLHM